MQPHFNHAFLHLKIFLFITIYLSISESYKFGINVHHQFYINKFFCRRFELNWPILNTYRLLITSITDLELHYNENKFILNNIRNHKREINYLKH